MSDTAEALSRIVQGALDARTATERLPRMSERTPDQNTPWQTAPTRARRVRTYRDPTGQTAVGNIKKQQNRRS